MKIFFTLGILMSGFVSTAQELFAYSEPASNMPAKSIGIRLSNGFMRMQHTSTYNYQLIPELMLGLSKNLMFHAEGFFDNRAGNFKANGGGLYAKYRFLSKDEVHSHFRMAAFTRFSYNRAAIYQPVIELNGMNSGYEAGIIATQLIQKTAISGGASFLHATDNGNGNKFSVEDSKRNAIGYNVSIGKLMLPKVYNGYDQTNCNFMLEIPGQVNLATGKAFLDLAPAIQFIFLSKMRIDLGYKFAVVKDLQRMSNDGFLLRLEYNFFNAFK